VSDPKELAEAMQRRYRNVFGTEEGHRVLGDIAAMGHVFDNIEPTAPELVAERNLALTILRMAGCLDVLYRQLGLDT
jgi:hypothetical protein